MCLQSYRSSALDKYCTNRGHEQVDIKNYNILLHLNTYVIGKKIGNFNFLVHRLLESEGLYNKHEVSQCNQSMQEPFESTIRLKL